MQKTRILMVKFCWVGVLFLGGILNAQAKVVHLSDFLKDRASSDDIAAFQATETLEIGGTHTYGGKTKDLKSIIVNPDNYAHDNNSPALGLKGSGFSETFIKRLIQTNKKLNHRFKKIVINTLGFTLPIPDKVPIDYPLSPEEGEDLGFGRHSHYSISVWQQKAITDGTADWGDGLWYGLLAYADTLNEGNQAVGSYSFDLYQSFGDLLEDAGTFEFRSAYLPALNSTFIKGVCSFKAIDYDQCTCLDCPVPFMKDEDRTLFDRIDANLKDRGDLFELDESTYKMDKFIYSELYSDTRASLKVQYFLLKRAGFSSIKVSFGIVKNNGFASTSKGSSSKLSRNAYQMFISAQKTPQEESESTDELDGKSGRY